MNHSSLAIAKSGRGLDHNVMQQSLASHSNPNPFRAVSAQKRERPILDHSEKPVSHHLRKVDWREFATALAVAVSVAVV